MEARRLRNASRPASAAAAFLAAAAALLAPCSAGAIEMRRWVAAAGAVNAAAGSFALQATIGEPGPVSMITSGGSFAHGEGFWAGFDILSVVAVPPSVADVLPRENRLDQNAPNPFASETEIAFAVAHAAPVRLAVYDASGRRVALLDNGVRGAGRYALSWPGRDDAGRVVANGIYFYRLDVGAWSQTKKMLKLR